jgi:hypothetical protein
MGKALRATTRMAGMAAAMAAVLCAAGPAAAGGQDPGRERAARLAEVRATMNAERDAGRENAAQGLIRTAMEHFQRLSELMDEEYRLLRHSLESDPLPGADLRKALDYNRTEKAEVVKMISLLRVVGGR